MTMNYYSGGMFHLDCCRLICHAAKEDWGCGIRLLNPSAGFDLDIFRPRLSIIPSRCLIDPEGIAGETTMIHLPRGKAVKTEIDLGEVDLLTALTTLHQGRFTGYLSFRLTEGSAVLLFRSGRLTWVLYQDAQRCLMQVLGLEKTFQTVRKTGGRLNVYRLDEDLVALLPIVLGGTSLLRGAPLGKVNIRAVVERMSREKRTGCLRVYSQDRVALIFYREGHPLGFFHDDCGELVADADLSMSVAREKDAKLDVLVPTPGLLADTVDLMDDAETLLS